MMLSFEEVVRLGSLVDDRYMSLGMLCDGDVISLRNLTFSFDETVKDCRLLYPDMPLDQCLRMMLEQTKFFDNLIEKYGWKFFCYRCCKMEFWSKGILWCPQECYCDWFTDCSDIDGLCDEEGD